MRIRLPFAGVFATLLLLSAYTSLTPAPQQPDNTPTPKIINPQLIHLLTLFTLTITFYWSLDTTRRRILHLTLLVCTAALGVGSELLRALVLPRRDDGDTAGGRGFDILNIVANVVGSVAGLGLCAWYHKRMLERKRLRKYTAVPTTAGEGNEGGEEDLELGEGPGLGSRSGVEGEHEEGVTGTGTSGGGSAGLQQQQQRGTTLEEEVDNWDENAIDAWEEDEDAGDVGVAGKGDGGAGAKKRAD